MTQEECKQEAGHAKSNSFEWMESWLIAYEKANGDIDTKKIMDWIQSQPMTCG